jgi:L-malate glycosyltransferase
VRILLVEFTGAMSGAERSLLELVQGLQGEHDVTLACPTGPLADRAAELGVRVFSIPASQLTFRLHPRHTPRGLAAMGRTARRLRAIVRTVQPDVVHANSIRAGLLAIPAARGSSPVVVHCRDALPRGAPGALVRAAVLNGADQVVAISRHVATALAGAGWSARRVTVVENAVDLRRFDPAVVPRAGSRSALGLHDGLVLSVIAQITPWKGQDLAIRALGELRDRRREALLLIVGEAKFVGAATRHDNRAFEKELHALVKTLSLGGCVRFLGERNDAERILAATDVLLVPSTEEPFGRTIIEAMAMGVPVAATSVGGPAEILSDGIGGCVVHRREAAAWADAVEDLAAWASDRRAGARSKAAARFSREQHVTAMLGIYASALARDGSTVFRSRGNASASIKL